MSCRFHILWFHDYVWKSYLASLTYYVNDTFDIAAVVIILNVLDYDALYYNTNFRSHSVVDSYYCGNDKVDFLKNINFFYFLVIFLDRRTRNILKESNPSRTKITCTKKPCTNCHTKEKWQHPLKRSSETLGQTNINNCRVSELNNQNVNVKRSKLNFKCIFLKNCINKGYCLRTYLHF